MKKSFCRGLTVGLIVSSVVIANLSKGFAQASYTLTVSIPSSFPKGGTITSSPGGINCGSDCSQSFAAGTSVTLTASVSPGYSFAYWTNDPGCSGGSTSQTCTFTMTQNKTIGALWTYSSINLNISKIGTGSGTVTGSPGISCGSTCSTSISSPKTGYITLSATPAADSTFAGWHTSGTMCHSTDDSKGGAKRVSTSTTCKWPYNMYAKNLVAVPKFDKKVSADTTSPTPSSSPSTSPTTDSSQDSTTTTRNSTPAIPVISSIKVAGQTISAKEPFELSADQPLVLSGKTIANGIVTLTIHSTPRTVTLKADKDGSWSYIVTDLEAGEHFVEARVTNPSTKKSSKTTRLASFTVNASDQTPTSPDVETLTPANKKSNTALLALIPLAGLFAGTGWYGWKQWNKKKKKSPPPFVA